MNVTEAKEILLLYRPGTRDSEDPQVAEALRLAEQDPELRQWLAEHQVFQSAMRASLRAIPSPERLKLDILANYKVVRPPAQIWRQPVWLAAAAIFIALLSLCIVWFRPSVPNRFSHYRQSMVTAAVRMYGMDLVTKDPDQLRQFIARAGAPADYDLTQGLTKLQLKGGGLLRWRGNPVSMVCFDRGPGTTLFLFVMKRSAIKDPPPSTTADAELAQVNGMMTASWTNGADTYVLAGPMESNFAEKYLSP